MPGQAWFKGSFRYLAALLCVGCAFGVRIALDPMFGGTSFIFSIFYLAVVLAAYFAGTGPAIAASVLSAILAYWAFAAPAFAIKVNIEALTSMAFFALTSAVDIYFITGMTRALDKYRREHQRAEALAEGNASLFKEFSERTTHHLQLVAALLQSRATDGVDAVYRTALTEASLRTMAISRAHRALADDSASPVDVSAFARQLMRATLDTAGLPGMNIDISGEIIMLPPERATSTAVILLEWVRAVIRHPARDPRAPIRLLIGKDQHHYKLRLATSLPEADLIAAPLMDDISRRIVDAAIDQIEGRFTYYRDAMNAVFELVMPIDPPVIADIQTGTMDPPSSLLH